ncbi:hypothetical protein [Lentzea cavernae]|uniref:hypothetical protein n=1 Tax=Lentzea cavernae TaxID=2020703 RepID=UPI00174D5F8C|nr:hypothetical protein [Lentzea cavernae]
MVLFRLIRAAITALAGSVVTLAQLNLPSRSLWESHVVLQYVSVIVIAMFVCYDAVRSFDQAIQNSKIRAYDRRLRAALSATVASIVDEFGTPWDEIAVYHYQVTSFWPWRRLSKVDGVRAGASTANVQPYYKIGKGLAGTAVSEQVLLAEEWRDFVQRAIPLKPDGWIQLDERKRYGLSWGELMGSERPLGMVANPVFGPQGAPSGCLVVTGPMKLNELSGNEMRQILSDAATEIQLMGPAPRGWWSFNAR